MDVLGIDENGELYCPETTEVPQFAPGVLEDPEKGNGAGLLPLTFFQPATATSHVSGREPLYATDDSVLTWWQPEEGDDEPWVMMDLTADYTCEAVRIVWRDINMDVTVIFYGMTVSRFQTYNLRGRRDR